ncbi:unnamed protein product [Sphagnum troendelagicum]|uniref:Haem-binding uptake Tiki superfamily ChaN domain-containing protein n=1 Tax=Sphagnum troendelagicum TaxID=128251 RepID=A0ABP0TQQ9_9BRYO
MLLGAVCTSLAFSSWSTAGAEQEELKTATQSATSGTGGFAVGIDEKGRGSEVESGNGEKDTGSRVYDATVLGEPVPVGGEKGRVWQKLLAARVVYLGEAERVPDPDDKVLELEIVRTLRNRCFEQQRPVSLALDAFPTTLQPQLNKYMSKKLSDDELRAAVGFWPDGQWQEYLSLLQYCRASGVRLMACGTPPEVLRTIQAEGIQHLKDADRRKYVPPIGWGFGATSNPIVEQLALADVLPKSSVPYGVGSYQFAQARIVMEHTMAQVVTQGMADGGSVGLLIVVTGASHLLYGSRGVGLPARISRKLQKKTQVVVLLNPERQRIRMEGNVPEADFLWYSAQKPCTQNCFDRAEVARVMDAAGSTRDALPQDIQAGLERGLVSPKVLQSFFELDKHPYFAQLSRHFQGLRERWLADPRFLQRLGIEETISITTTLIAQYERRGSRFWSEIEYVITDTVRGAVVDFFTVWLPAPTLSFRSLDSPVTGSSALDGLRGLLESLPDNAFQRARLGENFDLSTRLWAVVVGGLKLFGVGFVSSIGTLSVSNGIWAIRKVLKPDINQKPTTKRSPVIKTALVYGSFLGLSANLRYQAIAGIVEHWIADYLLASQPLLGGILSFVARTGNSYWGTQQWVDLARATGLQAQKAELPSLPLSNSEEHDPKDKTLLTSINNSPEPSSSSLIDSVKNIKSKSESSDSTTTL